MRRYFLTTARSYGRQSHPRSGGASPETIPRRSGEWRPRGGGANRTAGGPGFRPPGAIAWRGQVAVGSGATAGDGGAGPRPKTATVGRREGSRSHRGMVVAPRTRDKTKECACRRSTHPSVGGNGIAAVAKVTSGPARRSLGEGGAKRKDKPGRTNAPRERRGLRCLTS